VAPNSNPEGTFDMTGANTTVNLHWCRPLGSELNDSDGCYLIRRARPEGVYMNIE
jgi:hypothetical protein